MKNGIIALLIIVVVGVGVFLLMRNKDKPTVTNTTNNTTNQAPATTPTTKPSSTAEANSVDITGFAYSPVALTVKKGTKVTWTNKDSAAHTVTADVASANAPDSGSLAKGDTFNFVFDTPGTYAYHCKFHPQMLATVTVTE